MIHQVGVLSNIIKKSAWDLVYREQNRDVREISRNLIGSLEDWGLENTDFSSKIKTLDWCITSELLPMKTRYLIDIG